MQKREVEYQSNYKSSTSQKINWLIKHSPLWEGLKLPDEWNRIIIIAKLMKDEGYYSKFTYSKDIQISVSRLITKAREVKRERLFKKSKKEIPE